MARITAYNFVLRTLTAGEHEYGAILRPFIPDRPYKVRHIYSEIRTKQGANGVAGLTLAKNTLGHAAAVTDVLTTKLGTFCFFAVMGTGTAGTDDVVQVDHVDYNEPVDFDENDQLGALMYLDGAYETTFQFSILVEIG